jgi:hypothetical protein
MSNQRETEAARHAAADAHWAAISQATQVIADSRVERRRVRVGAWLVRVGLRLAGPLTVEHLLLKSSGSPIA